jgi:hypothetical protein
MSDLTAFLGEPPLEASKKICSYCKVEKTLDEFAYKLDHHDKRDNRCKECIRKQVKTRKTLRRYVRSRPNICECCGKSVLEQSNNRKQIGLFLDHDHKTGEFRGWICHDCNSALARAGDNLDGVMKLVKYLEKHETRTTN